MATFSTHYDDDDEIKISLYLKISRSLFHQSAIKVVFLEVVIALLFNGQSFVRLLKRPTNLRIRLTGERFAIVVVVATVVFAARYLYLSLSLSLLLNWVTNKIKLKTRSSFISHT